MVQKSKERTKTAANKLRAIIWLPELSDLNDEMGGKEPIILQNKLAKTSILSRQLKVLEENSFTEIYFVYTSNSLKESIKKKLDQEKDYWHSKDISFGFCELRKIHTQMEYWQRMDPEGSILNIAAEWLIDNRIIKTILLEKKDSEEEQLDAKEQKIKLVREDREEFLKKNIRKLHLDALLPIIFLPGETIQKVVSGIVDSIKNNEQIKTITDLMVLCQKIQPKIISLSSIPTYNPSMRRKVPIYYFVVKEAKDFREVKWSLVKLTQKGTLDFIAWYFNRPLENLTLYLIANGPFTPNHITLFVNIIAFIVAGCFIAAPYLVTNHLMLSKVLPWLAFIGLIIVNILDGVDGKLARIRDKLTLLGHLEHSFDQLYEQTVYFAAMWYCLNITSQNLIPWIFLIIAFLIIDTFSRHVSMQYYIVMKISLADSGRLDRIFRRIDGRRNTYTIHFLMFLLIPWKQYLIISMLVHATITGIIYATRAIYHLNRADKEIYPEIETI
ncbi:MAG: CDP-alcohol phosphatidyltransferase family protein [Candidatus Heimdallarchaeota archaeon]